MSLVVSRGSLLTTYDLRLTTIFKPMKKLFLITIFAVTAVSMMAQPARSIKRGVGENAFTTIEELEILAPGVTWYYNWGIDYSSAFSDVVGPDKAIEYMPMIWGTNYDASRIPADAQYLLGFNEPNLITAGHGGSDITPEQAVEPWHAIEQIAQQKGLQLVAPALNYSGDKLNDGKVYSTPEIWFDAFIAAYKAKYGVEPRYDYLALHSYMNSPQAVLSYVENFAKKYGKQVWLTEFCSWEGTVSEASQINAMVQKVQLLEQSEWCARYAWFKAKGNNSAPFYRLLVTPGLLDPDKTMKLSTLGKIYVHMSTFDKNYWWKVGDVIPAKDYIDATAVELSENTDAESSQPIQISSLGNGCSASYQIEVPSAGEYTLGMRISSRALIANPKIQVLCDGTEVANQEMPVTGATSAEDKWEGQSITFNLPAGKHTLTIKNTQSSFVKLNWIALGLSSGISQIENRGESSKERGERNLFNLAGQRVSKDYKGIVIKNGKRYIK